MSCFLSVDMVTPANELSLVKISKVSQTSNGPKPLEKGMKIENEVIELTFTGVSQPNILEFQMLNKALNQKEELTLSLGYYDSLGQVNVFKDPGQQSGDYIFRPRTGEFHSKPYSKIGNMTISGGAVDSEFSFYFGQADGSQQANIHVSIDKDTNTLRAEVEFGSLPFANWQGTEVVALFNIKNFVNNGTFYTDSNALEMQERHLNFRPTWDLINTNYKDSLENVTANYFPINSAISINDVASGRRFTVMNDRPQGATSLVDGQIEIMQHRRIPYNDARGMGEQLNELDDNGDGIKVRVTYYIEVAYPEQTPFQRLVQQKTDNPTQVAYTFALAQTNKLVSEFRELNEVAGTIKMVATPVGKNHFRLRVENIADVYDRAATQFVDLKAILTAMWQRANAKKLDWSATTFSLTEMSLTANMSLKEKKERQIQWRTKDDEFMKAGKLDYSTNPSAISLEPQRIRMFDVVVSLTEQTLFLN